MMSVDKVVSAAEAGFKSSLDRLFELLRIPSISTDPAYAGPCDDAAAWLVKELKALGFEASVRPTPGRPMVVAHYTPQGATPKTPHALFYGHYDVQPVDPIELWHTKPFEPTLKKGADGVERIYGRGTADDKGQLMTFVEAARAWIATTGSLPVKATFLIEGEEESGSPSLIPFLKANKAELSCDVAFVCDTGMWDEKTPAITTRLRGLVHEEVEVEGPSIDLHSGMYGGPATNPIRALSKLVASLHDKNGKVTIPGFYDGVAPLSKATKKQWASLKFSEKKFLGSVGLKSAAGEKGFSVLEQIWARPTAEVNGMWGGYTGAGTKTVIASKAHAKFTFRLVGKQSPQKVLKAFQAFAKKQMMPDAKLRFSGKGSGAPASEIADGSVYIQKSAAALKAEWGRETMLIGGGGSIPIVRHFKDILGMDSVLVGFGLDDDAIHSPNEKYNLTSFQRGIKSWVRIFGALAR
ncbi:M20/M25/M40 family metallo-hydrolase [Aestuariivirga litoralis]|uniref:M20/M25/M40 family metallo-hydrolase n=1 Tax=Aestuariivirga litoralis TaxID=2650924 RepID=UPI0018C6DFC8|nr:M20/M25/M40 family metallo-hydrolase [Aestuariivirga litoralis]MBG1232280.1 M20/M25/M40 family metallo-hydrolase [Aestuariivirga litoralis]